MIQEEIQKAVDRKQWIRALELCQGLEPELRQSVLQYKVSSNPDLISLQEITDDLFVASICLHFTSDDPSLVKQYLDLGISKSSDPSLLVDSVNDFKVIRQELLARQDLLCTWKELGSSSSAQLTNGVASPEVDNDGWDLDDTSDIVQPTAFDRLPFELVDFLNADYIDIANVLAQDGRLLALARYLLRHGQHVGGVDRLAVLDQLDDMADPVTLLTLLPHVSGLVGLQKQEPWRTNTDWSEARLNSSSDLPIADISAWLKHRILKVEKAGFLDTALLLVQHGPSHNITGLDELGEDLSLLSRFIYDSKSSEASDWTLDRWQKSQTAEIVQSYLQNSSPDSIVRDYKSLVTPYLYVVEAKLERAGVPDPALIDRSLRELLFGLARKGTDKDLSLLVSLIEASKPTLPFASRLVRYDAELARIVISCLYGCQRTDQWEKMSRIFECLPAFESRLTDIDLKHAIEPSAIYEQLRTMPADQLACLMDRMDVHLESAEILSRWHVGVALSDFLKPRNRTWQTQLANKMVIKASRNEALDKDDWLALREDICKLGQGDGQFAAEKVFNLLSQHEIVTIFYKALLSAGKFSLAKPLVQTELLLSSAQINSIVLETSRELYGSTESGNMHSGQMKLAYECLAIAPQQDADISKERDLIEATSRLASYNLLSDKQTPLIPMQIRTTDDKLSLIEKVLSSNSTAYQYQSVLLEILKKLGQAGDRQTRIKLQLMIGRRATVLGDYHKATEVCLEVFTALDSLSRSTTASTYGSDLAVQACDLAVQIASADKNGDKTAKARLLSQVLLLCPASETFSVLATWRLYEETNIQSSPARAEVKPSPISATTTMRAPSLDRSVLSRAADSLRSASPTAINRSGSPLPKFDALLHGREGGVRDTINQRFTSGVSWLIGTDEAAES